MPHHMLNAFWVPSEIPAWAVGIMNEEPSLTDEVVMVIGDSEIVNRLVAGDRVDGGDHAPLAADGLQAVADAHLSCGNPRALRFAALDPERVPGAGTQRIMLALDAHLKQLVVVRGGQRGDGSGLQFAGGAVAGHDLVADCDLLDGRVAVVGVDGRAGGEGICGCVARASVSVIRSDVPQTQQFLLASASAGLL